MHSVNTGTTKRRRPISARLIALACTILSLLTLTLPAAAQQLPNPGFEDGWGAYTPYSSGNTQNAGTAPAPWKISQVAGIKILWSWQGLTIVGEEAPGHNGGKSAKIYNSPNSVAKSQIVPGYISLGTPWATSTGTDAKNKDGGTFGGYEFNYRPDAICYYYKRDEGVASNAEVVAYGWKGTWTQADVPAATVTSGTPNKVTMTNRDRNILGESTSEGGAVSKTSDAKLIYQLKSNIGKATDWTKNIHEFTYADSEDPQMINVIFTANDNYWDNSGFSAGNALYIDDVKLLYFSRLYDVTIGEITIPFADGDYSAQYPGYLSEIADSDIEYELAGQGKSATVSIERNEADNQLVITVSNANGEDSDGLSQHTYTIQCYKPVNEVIFPASIPATMLTGDVMTISAADFTFAPEGAHEASLASLTADQTVDAILAEADGVYTLTAVNPCTVTLTATSPNGTTATRTVTIEPRPLTSIAFKQEKYSIVASKSRTFSVDDLIFGPDNAYDKSFTLTVNDPRDAANVVYNDDRSEVTVTPYVKEALSITAASKAYPEVNVTVDIEVGDKVVVPEKIREVPGFDIPAVMYIGETAPLTIPVQLYPEEFNVPVEISWSCDNAEVLAVDAKTGTITFAEGAVPAEAVNVTVKGTFTDENDETGTVEKTFTFGVRQPVTALTWLNAEGEAITKLDFKEHETPVAHAVIAPDNASDRTVDITFEGDDIVDYDPATGVLTAKGFGRAVLVATAMNDSTPDNGRHPLVARLDVSVAAMPTSITITGPENYWVGKSFELATVIEPVEASAAALTWSSDNETVATVDANGVLDILAEGNATITATAENGVEGSLTIKSETYKGITRDIKGWISVTDADSAVTTVETVIALATTSPTEMTLTINDFKIKGMRLGDLTLENIAYSSAKDNKDGHTVLCSLSGTGTVTAMNGSIEAEVSIADAEVDFNAATANIPMDITVTSWDGEKASAIFSTDKPKEPSKPVGPGGIVTKYPGTISFNVTPDPDSEESVRYDLAVMVTVTDKGEKDDEENDIVTIEFPAMKFHKVYFDGRSRSSEGEEEGVDFYYLYDFAPFTLTDVKAMKAGNTTVYTRDKAPVKVTLPDETESEYNIGLTGSATEQGEARMALAIDHPADGSEIKGSFSNTEGHGGEVYEGKLTIDMGGTMIADGQDATVNIIPDEAGTSATFVLPNLTLHTLGMSLGDIRVEDVQVESSEDGMKYYTGSVTGMKLMDGSIEADVNLSGSVTPEGYADMTIAVLWNGIEINVKFTGDLADSTTGITAPEAAEPQGSSRWFNLSGVPVNPDRLAPGIYIERRGGMSRKVLVR